MSCCWSKKLFGRRSKREDCYKVQETEEAKEGIRGPPEGGEQIPQYSWDRREKIDPAEFTVQGLHGQTLKKEGKEGGPLQIENCTDSTILFLHRTSQVIIDECRHCTIILGPSAGSVFVRDSSNCTILLSCQQLRTRDCTSVRIGILCPTEPIVENSNDVFFHHLALFYPELKEQMYAAGLRPFTNRIVSAHDFTPAGSDGKKNFKVFVEPVTLSNEQESLLSDNDVSLLSHPDEFIPRFSDVSDNDPTFVFVLGKAEPADELGDKANELLRAVYSAEMNVQATYDVATKDIDAKMIPFAGKAERMILLQLSGNLAQLETDVEFDLISENDMEPLQKLLIHLNGKKSG
ncbi:unnamed protein product [Caenorhabditis sp. 36 PRJEB53466]|nr:unnamed protein product [Caenorhabditis sp. 36 PRJEB53466]